jgi:preprotein translocase subunit SecD
VADGVYAVRRASQTEKDLLPLKADEVVVVNHHRYLQNKAQEPPRFLVVRSSSDVPLDLATEPTAQKEGAEVVRVLLKLRPQAAEALERLTRDHSRQIAVVLNGEVVTEHKVRTAISSGDIQITSCTPGAARYLLEQLQARYKDR